MMPLLYLTAFMLADFAAHDFGNLLSPVGLIVLPATATVAAFRASARSKRDAILAALRVGAVYGLAHQAIVLFQLFILGINRSQLPAFQTGGAQTATLTTIALAIGVTVTVLVYLGVSTITGLLTFIVLRRQATRVDTDSR